jgi:hypothetical protein
MITKLDSKVPKELIIEAKKQLPTFDERLTINQPLGDFFYDPWVIKPEFIGSVWDQILNTIPYDKGEARIIRLKIGESYLSHADIDDRWHLNLQSQQSFLINLSDLVMHPITEDQSWYSMNAGYLHTASNYGSIDRIQLVVRQLLQSATSNNLVKVCIRPAGKQHDYRYKFDNIVSPWLNYASKKRLISNFSFEKEVVKFNLDSHYLKELSSLLTKDFLFEYE